MKTTVKPIAVFASGAGTNAEALIKHFQTSEVARVALVVTNKADAGVIHVAERHKVPWIYLPKPDLHDEEMVMSMLRAYGIKWIALAGWLLLVPPFLVKAFKGRLVNVHPALLPKFGGEGMYGARVHAAVKAAKANESGISIHHVNEHYDEGEVIAQFKVTLLPSDNAATIEQKVRALELAHFAPTLEALIGASPK